MDVTDCPCKCHAYPYGADDCPECDGTGRVIDDDAVLQAVREVEAEAAAEAVPDTFRRRVVDPGTPPCCSTPQLCGGPHEGCPEAVSAPVTAPDSTGDTGTAEWSLQRLLSLVCDAPAPCPSECPPCVAPADYSAPCCPPDDFCPQCR